MSEWNVYSYDRVITNGSHVLARVRGGDIQLLDFSDPVQPRILDSISSPKGDFIGVSEGHLHFVSEFFIESVAVLDDGPMPSLAAGEPIDRVLCFGASFWNGQCVAGGGHILSYTASRICLLDLSDPGEPMPLGCSAVALSAERPLAAVSDRGAWLLDGSDLTAVSFVKAGRPLRIETRSLPLDDVWLPRNMQIVNGYLLLIRSPGADPRSPQRIELFDISEPLAPSRIVGIDFDAGPVSGPVEAGNQLWFAQGGRLSRIEPGGPGSATVLPVLEINPEAVLMSDGERLFLRQDLDGLTRLWPIAIEARAQLRIGEAVELRSSLRELSLSAGVAFGLTTSGTLLAFDLGRDAPGRVLGVLREPPYQRNRIGPAWRRLLDAREGRLTVTDVHGGVAIVQVRQ